MARRLPDFRRSLGVEVLAHRIVQPRSASFFEAVSADADSLDGKNVHFGLIDELHAHRSRDVYDAIETGAGKRDQSMLWAITTAGSDKTGICFEQRAYVLNILKGTIKDENYFGIVYTIDDGDDWTSEATWRKANPNYGISVEPEHGPRSEDRAFEGESCVIAVDLASKTDIAAVIVLFERQGKIIPFGRFYLPQSAIDGTRHAAYRGWAAKGWITPTPGDIIDFSMIEADLMSFTSRFQVRNIAYDPWQATQLATRLKDQGASVIEFRQTVANFSEPTKELDGLMRSDKIAHDGNPALSWMIGNVVGHYDAKDNVYPRKERSENKIDGAIALIMAIGLHPAPDERTKLDEFLAHAVMVSSR